MVNNRLQNKVAIVTGSGQGIGAAIARVFAQEGARVVVATRTEKNGGETSHKSGRREVRPPWFARI